MIGGAAVGAAGVGAAYEYQNKKQMDRLEEDFKAGNISKEEYLKRKEDIKSGSIIYWSQALMQAVIVLPLLHPDGRTAALCTITPYAAKKVLC